MFGIPACTLCQICFGFKNGHHRHHHHHFLRRRSLHRHQLQPSSTPSNQPFHRAKHHHCPMIGVAAQPALGALGTALCAALWVLIAVIVTLYCSYSTRPTATADADTTAQASTPTQAQPTTPRAQQATTTPMELTILQSGRYAGDTFQQVLRHTRYCHWIRTHRHVLKDTTLIQFHNWLLTNPMETSQPVDPTRRTRSQPPTVTHTTTTQRSQSQPASDTTTVVNTTTTTTVTTSQQLRQRRG